MAERDYKSIGEVLTAVQDEFPDITISKIRFLETQGLIEPERTPSGYRKFSDADVAQLDWILRQQRDHFLPLKVIKERLDEDAPAQSPRHPKAVKATRKVPPLDLGSSGSLMSADALCDTTGLTAKQLRELERYGLVESRSDDGAVVYDDDALTVARTAAAFIAHGLEPRHLKAYKSAAEREAGVFEQLALPLAKSGGASSERSAELLGQLVGLGEDMRHALLRRALRSAHLPG
jgi:DNA-binding transcriptional MerR regulator